MELCKGSESEIVYFHDVCKRYGSANALQHVDLAIEQGAVCALIGENGAGKSTLIRILLGLSAPTSGSVALFGHTDAAEVRAARARIGYMPDLSGAWMHLSARANMKARCAEWGVPSDCIDGLLQFVGLAETGRKPIHSFSLGMKRRLDLAVALLGEPELLVLDEPINGLDPTGVAAIRDLLVHLNRDMKKTVLLSSHNLDELDKVATQFVFIKRGAVVRSLSKAELEAERAGAFMVEAVDGHQAGRIADALGAQYAPAAHDETKLEIACPEGAEADLLTRLTTNGLGVKAAYRERMTLDEYYRSLLVESEAA